MKRMNNAHIRRSFARDFSQLALLMIITFIFAACGGGGGGDAGQTPPDSTDDGSGNITTSTELIDQALADGRLDPESALLYKAFATFNDPRLPAEFTGDVSGVVDPDFLWEANDNFDTLSVETQETLAPFLIPPMYSGSWWDLQQNMQGTATLNAAATDAPCNPLRSNCPLLTTWKYIAGTNVNVWYQERYESADLVKAMQVVTLMEAVWPDLTAYMGAAPLPDRGGSLIAYEGPDTKLDIALVDMGPLGTTYPSFALKSCGNASTYILLNRTADVGPTVVHEFMHSIQFSLDVHECLTTDYKTLMESTANWAVNRIFGTSNQWEHQHIYAYTDDITVPLLYEAPPIRPYGAYLFPLYLTEAESPDAVKQAWSLAASYSQSQVIENVTDLDRVWPQFAARLWNQPPLDKFSQWDGISKQVRSGMDTINLDLAGKQYEEWIVTPDDLSGLSAHIFHVVFHDPSIRTAGFFNGFTYRLAFEDVPELGQIVKAAELTPEQRLGAHLHALVKIDGVWENTLRDWTDVPYVLFPIDLPGPKVQEVLLVFTNSSSDIDSSVQYTGLPSHFWLTNMPWASSWKGSADFRSTDDGVVENFRATDLRFELSMPQLQPLLEAPDPDADLQMIPYQLTAGSAIWDISGTDSNGCSYDGSGATPLATGLFPNQLMLYSFIRSGPAVHGFILNGFDQNPPAEFPVTVTCPDGQGGSTTDVDSWGLATFWLSAIPGDSSSAMSSNGLQISGTGADAIGTSVSGNWQLQVVP
ncbi:MAG: hypothetical protein VR64_00920 [Desulfatitalea sp. BRH_c12]|nr:MAG: hypothetical protein VR64_00920 [Desulfatitalea sp. BRH_c12]